MVENRRINFEIYLHSEYFQTYFYFFKSQRKESKLYTVYDYTNFYVTLKRNYTDSTYTQNMMNGSFQSFEYDHSWTGVHFFFT